MISNDSNAAPSYGSSETKRKAPSFSTIDFYEYGHAPHVPRIPESFLEWFVGFFEGDGCIYSYYDISNPKAKRLKLEIAQKEKAIIVKLTYTFGFGNISSFEKKGRTYWRWKIESKNALERIAFLLSGNLILPKRQEQFLNWIDVGQQKGLFQPPFNRNKPWTATPSFDNGWLSGFIDAEGGFYARFWQKSGKMSYGLAQKMTLTQLDKAGGEEQVFLQILDLFESTKKVFQFKNHSCDSRYVRIELHSLQSQEFIVNYLLKYKLRTKKYIAFRRWWRVYLRRKNGVHLTEKGIRRMWRLVKSINIQRKT